MQATHNRFKEQLGKRAQIGMFSTLGGGLLLELLGACGFDWILIDTEHSPSETPDIVAQLQILAASPTSAIVRPPSHDPIYLKRLLDIGVENLLVPDVRFVDEAIQIVAATRYPPFGRRGVSGNSRAARFGLDAGYLRRADENVCLLLQIESVDGLANLERIAEIPGVDGIFLGAADLAASMGHLGEPGHPAVVAAIDEALATLRRLGKPSGFLAVNEVERERRLHDAIDVFGITSDTALITRGARDLVKRFASHPHSQ
ncbi:HpcH/HpaI aldolase/citrate lyase family protein [Burkholderia sp. 22PA0099]|uniref:HpcH/HpaI aldolase family protein n=1 Tax=Burkholderia sp. 22PA0099 TaxID=3237372 RepID=UPI0039C0C9F0